MSFTSEVIDGAVAAGHGGVVIDTGAPTVDATTEDGTRQDAGAELMRGFVPASPFVAHAGIELVDVGDGRAELRLPFRDEIATMGTVVHGGAIATLVDTAAMAAAWAGAELPDEIRGATVALSVTYLAPADGEDVTAVAEVLRRGRRLTTVRVDVTTSGGTPVASGLVTYQLG